MRTVYGIRDTRGELIAEHVRVETPGGKRLYWQLPDCDPRDGLVGLSTPALPLYGSERIPSFAVGRTVVICEGERAAEALWSLGIDALGTVTGAGATPGEDALSVLLPFDVVLWPDHDTPGQSHMDRVAHALDRLGGGCRRLSWGHAKGDDAADCVADGGNRALIDVLIRTAEPWRITQASSPRPIRPSYDRHDDDGRVDQARSHLARVVEGKLGPPVRHMGRSLFWRCPFHAGDRDPSFKVDLREPFYRCFGCDARGDVFTFLRASEGVDFKDALRELAPAPRRLVEAW